MSSVIRQLTAEQLDEIHGVIWQDGKSDLDIARMVEALLGRKIAPNDHAREAVVARYRKSAAYTQWRDRRDRQYMELQLALVAQKERYRLISSVVKKGQEDDFEAVSKSVQARLLALAAEANDSELKEAAKGKGWISNTLQLIRDTMDDKYRKQIAALKEQLQKETEAVMGDGKLSDEERKARVKAIFDLK